MSCKHGGLSVALGLALALAIPALVQSQTSDSHGVAARIARAGRYCCIAFSAPLSRRNVRERVVQGIAVRIPSAPPGSRREPPWVLDSHNPSNLT
jgi:hypothetical protein